MTKFMAIDGKEIDSKDIAYVLLPCPERLAWSTMTEDAREAFVAGKLIYFVERAELQ
jgi:hypothetical protein